MALVLEGKYLAAWIGPEGASLFLDLRERAAEHHRWVVIGRWEGESPIGIWIEVAAVEERGPQNQVLRGWTVEPSICLIRWDWIVTAQVYEEKPREVGFRPTRIA